MHFKAISLLNWMGFDRVRIVASDYHALNKVKRKLRTEMQYRGAFMREHYLRLVHDNHFVPLGF